MQKKFFSKLIKSLLALTLVFGVVNWQGLITRASAAEETGPEHDKTLKVNNDGTYTIALNVKGDADKQPTKANVIVVFDTSSSMNTNTGNTETTYTQTDSTGGWNYQNNLYGLVNGEYVQLSRTSTGNWPNITYHFWYNNNQTEYTGQRYTRQQANQSRLQAAEEAVNELAAALLAYNGKDGNPDDTIEIALVDFANTAEIAQTPTTDYDTFEAVVNSRDAGNNNRGTNWEAGFRTALNVNFGTDDDEKKQTTYVIFVSDGNPTFYMQDPGNTQRGGSGQETTDNINTSYNQAVPAAKAVVDAGYELYTIGIYGNVDRMESITTAAGADASHYYSAEDTAALQAALAEILAKIEMAGIGNVGITDGTTSQVQTRTGVSHLLDVDTNSYKYYRAGGKNSDNTEKYDSSANDGLGEEWTDAPAATFENGAVKWNISGVLEDDVTYTVTFDCWPSQETLDIVADIKNDPTAYDKLDKNIQNYITKDGNLATNTTATLSYDDTRTPEEEDDIEYVNPDPVDTTAVERLAVAKKWENKIDEETADAITLNVTRDGKDTYELTLSKPSWKSSVYISVGIMRTDGNKVELLTTGHNFTFTEPEDLGYYWELAVPVVRPMIVDGELKNLIKVDKDHPAPSGADTYEIPTKDGVEGGTYYVEEIGEAGLTATNSRRSWIDLKKVVDGEDADPEQAFQFTLNIVNSKASEGSADDLDSDYYVWFSVWNGGFVDALVSGATKEYTTVEADMVDDTGWTGYYYAPSGSNIVVNLKNGDNLRVLNLPSNTTYTITEGTLPANYAFTKSVLTKGTDTTFSGAQTTTGKIESTNMVYEVTYTNTYGLSDIEITKVWVDNDNQDGVRPTADEFKEYLTLKADGTDVTTANADKLTVEVDSEDENKYIVKWTGLDRFKEGNEIKYTVEESEIEGYTTTGSPAEDKGTITNSHEVELIDVEVTKIWDDNSDQDRVRPTSVKYQLYANGEVVEGKTIEVKAPTTGTADKWTAKFTGLEKNAGGEPIVYTIKELNADGDPVREGAKVDDNYTVTYPNGLTAKNSYSPETTSVTATKVWDDNNDQDGKRPDTITLRLYVGDTPVEGQDPKTIAKDATGDALTVSWTGLPKNDQGVAIEYIVKEDAVEYYTTEITGDKTKGFTVTNKHVPETTERTVEKVWNDNNDQDKLRPTELTVQLMNGTTPVQTVTLRAENEWKATVTGLPVYANGSEITYTWEEAEISGYTAGTPEVSKDGKVTTLTNTHTPKTTSIAVEKTWSDANDQDGLRANAKATVTLYKVVDGKDVLVEKDQDGKEIISVAVPTENGAVTTWINLPVYEKGEPIVYKVVETMEGTGYEATYDPSTQTIEAADKELSGTVKVTNTHVPAVQELTGTKVWDDASDQDGIRPVNVVITVTGKIEGKEEAVYTKEVTVTAGETPSDTWTWTITDAPVNAEGKPITYSVDEKVVPEGYEKSVSGMTVTNKHTTEKTEASVLKVWDDSENQDGKRPTSLTVALLANGEAAKDAEGKAITVTLNEGNSWTAKVENLEKNAGGKAITYSWSEDQTVLPQGYTLTGNTTKDTLTTLTNSYETEETQATVKKVWVDDNNRDGIQPTSLTVALLADGEAAKDAEGKAITVTLNADNGWTDKVEHLDKFADGKEIEYTWDEGTVTGYTLTTSVEGTITTLTNTHEPEKTTVSGSKTWTDNDDQDGIRPSKIIVYLLANGTKVQTLEVTPDEDGNWAYEFTGLNKNEAGKEITYTVEEEAVAGYTTTYSGNNIINTHTPDETTIEVIKNWDDSNNQDGKRSGVVAEVTLIKTVDGKETEIETVTVGAEDNWSKKWEKLPVNEGGKKITYSVKETLKTANGYTSDTTEAVEVANGGSKTIKNSYTPEVITLTVEKVWNDSDNNDGKRPANITVALLSDGTQIKQLTLSEQNKWLETVEGLPKYKAGEVGKEIKYTLKEMVVTDYETTYSDIVDGKITITNTHDKELINIPVEKIWVGDADYQEYRPEKITVVLVADGKETNMKVELNKDNGWKGSFNDIEKYSAGKEIDYTVKEIDLPAHYTTTEPAGDKTNGYKITNTFAPILFDPPVVKTIIGDKNDTSATFEFEMVAVTEGAPMPEGAADGKITITLPADGKPHEFGEVVITEVGKYEYIIREVAGEDPNYAYDATEYHLLFDVDVNAENELVCQLTVADGETETIVPWKELSGFPFEFVNEYRDYVTLEIEKVWDDGNDAQKLRPEEIEVEVLANGEVIFTVVLNEENEWKYEEVLPFSDDNYKEVTYSVNEKNVPKGYTVSYSQNEYKFTVTNTVTPPETSDASGISMWLAMFGVSVTNSLGLAYVSLKRKKEEQF